jgi:hypothetical protein
LDIKSRFKQTIQNLTSQKNQKQNATHIQVDCQIQTTGPKQNVAGFGQLLIVENHFICQD